MKLTLQFAENNFHLFHLIFCERIIKIFMDSRNSTQRFFLDHFTNQTIHYTKLASLASVLKTTNDDKRR